MESGPGTSVVVGLAVRESAQVAAVRALGLDTAPSPGNPASPWQLVGRPYFHDDVLPTVIGVLTGPDLWAELEQLGETDWGGAVLAACLAAGAVRLVFHPGHDLGYALIKSAS